LNRERDSTTCSFRTIEDPRLIGTDEQQNAPKQNVKVSKPFLKTSKIATVSGLSSTQSLHPPKSTRNHQEIKPKLSILIAQ
jgi:hypothetical protein